MVTSRSSPPPSRSPYQGSYKVLKRNNKTFLIEINGKTQVVSIERVKPAVLPKQEVCEKKEEKCETPMPENLNVDNTYNTKKDRRVTFNLKPELNYF